MQSAITQMVGRSSEEQDKKPPASPSKETKPAQPLANEQKYGK